MAWILIVLSSLCFVVVFIRLDILAQIGELSKIPLKVFKTIRSSRISDHWKEKVLPSYSLQLLLQSLKVFALLLISFSPFLLFSLLSIVNGSEFVVLASSFKGIAVSTVAAIFFAKLFSSKNQSDYGGGVRILHHIALGSAVVGETLFDIEKLIHGSQLRDTTKDRHIFIAGLARAGTTILMRTLYQNGNFRSLTYRDMPFILAPNTWRQITQLSTRKNVKKERAHGDGIEVDFDSPEALEEVFWRTFCGSDYIMNDSLTSMAADSEIVKKFRSFVSLILKPGDGERYLSKNNNNILRLGSIRKAFPHALIIVPFREPLEQACSLRHQHRKFQDSEDQFIQKYMTWLVHHEFGADHRPFIFEEKSIQRGDTESLEYWLRLWVNTYSYLVENLPSQAILISYERLCDDTEYVWQQLSEKVSVGEYRRSFHFTKSQNNVDEAVPQYLLKEAMNLHEKMMKISLGFRGKSEG